MGRALVGTALLVGALVGCTDDGSADRDGPATETEAAATDLEAAFTYDVELAPSGPTSCPVAEIRFTDASEGDPTAWAWEFGDGTTSTEPDPIVTHEVYEATLTVTRGDESDSVTEPVTFAVC